MAFIQGKTAKILLIAFVIVGLLGGIAVFQMKKKPASSFSGHIPDSFTFFDLGANARFDSQMRENLKNRLGSDSIAYRGTIDLIGTDKKFFQTHFDRLYELHMALNSPTGERVEHNIVKLTYRYSWRQDSPFKYVDLIFSNYTGLPLIFSIVMTQEGAGILDTLIQKYGNPLAVDDDQSSGKIQYWEKDRDILIVSVSPDRLGNLEYRVTIYFVNSLSMLLETEREENRLREEKIRRAADRAF